jgi:lipid-A-disaccharide synthase
LFVHTALAVAKEQTHFHFLVPMIDEDAKDYFLRIVRKEAPRLSWEIVIRQHREAIAAADAVLAASGTVTLEVALLERPMLIAYRRNPLTYMIAKKLVKTPWIGLPNILLQKGVVPELIQNQANPLKLARELCNLLDPMRAMEQVEAFRMLRAKVQLDTRAVLQEQLKKLLLL